MGRPSLQESHIHHCVELPCEAKIALSYCPFTPNESEKDQRTNDKHKGKASPSLAFGVNGPVQLFYIFTLTASERQRLSSLASHTERLFTYYVTVTVRVKV